MASPAPGSPNRRWRIVSLVLAIVCIGIGLLSVGLRAALQPAVDAYRAAPLCGAAVETGSCYTLGTGTVTSVRFSRNRRTLYTNLQMQLPDGVYPARLPNLSDADRAVVLPGASVPVQVYRRTITGVSVRGTWQATTANPVLQQQEASGGIFFLVVGAALGLVRLAAFLVRRRLRQSDLDPTTAASGRQAVAAVNIPDQAAPALVGLPLVLRPHLPGGTGYLVVAAVSVPLLVSLLFLGIRPQGDAAGVYWLFTGGWLLVVGAALWLYFRNAAIFVDELNVGTSDLLGRRRLIGRAEVAGIVLRTVLGTTSRNSRWILLVGADGRPLLRLYGQFYSDDQVRTLAGVLRVPIESE